MIKFLQNILCIVLKFVHDSVFFSVMRVTLVLLNGFTVFDLTKNSESARLMTVLIDTSSFFFGELFLRVHIFCYPRKIMKETSTVSLFINEVLVLRNSFKNCRRDLNFFHDIFSRDHFFFYNSLVFLFQNNDNHCLFVMLLANNYEKNI